MPALLRQPAGEAEKEEKKRKTVSRKGETGNQDTDTG